MNDRIWPNEPRGKDKYIPWLTKLLRAAKMSALKDVKVIGGVAKLQPGTDGTVLVITPPIGGAGTPAAGGNINMRGLWSATPSTPYMTYDAVILQTGTSTGVYWSTMDNNSNAPDSGLGWIQISTVSGQWL